MDEETKVRSDSMPKALVQEEFVSTQAICTVTAEVITSFSPSWVQKCLLKKAVLKLKAQSTALQPASTPRSKDSSQPAEDLDALESSVMTHSQEGAYDVAKTACRDKTFCHTHIKP